MSLDVLVPALAGYLLLRYSNLTRFGVARESGYHLVFRSALVGLGFYAVGWVVAGMPGLAPIAGLIDRLRVLEASTEDPRGAFEIGAAALWTPVLTGALVPASNVVYSRKTAERRAARRTGDFLACLVDRAGKNAETIELTLQDGKTCIGYVIESGIRRHGAEGAAVVVVPVWSGYRKPETQELVLTTNYAPLLAKSDWRRRLERLEVAIPRSEIRRARLFDIRLYGESELHWNDEKDPGPAP